MTTNSPPKIHFIGAGNMTTSLVGGLLRQGYLPDHISASDPSEAARTRLSRQHGITVFEDNHAGLKLADVVVLAVKPQHMHTVVTGLADSLASRSIPPVLLSIAAGITTGSIQRWAGISVPVVRCMPNTPAMIGQGASGLFATENVTESQQRAVLQIMRSVGQAWWLDTENQLDIVTAVSGSGPAYFFLFMQAIQEAGESLGLPPEISRQLVLQTARGAASLAMSSEVGLAQLRRQVTSPGGTTAAALETLSDHRFEEIVGQAVKAAWRRAGELSREFGD